MTLLSFISKVIFPTTTESRAETLPLTTSPHRTQAMPNQLLITSKQPVNPMWLDHHHLVVPLPWISPTLFGHISLSFIGSGRSSELHLVSSHSCSMYVRGGRPAFARPYVGGVHRSTSFMSSSLLLQQCPACLARLAWIVFVMGGRWPYSWCLVGFCRQDLFNIARKTLV